MECSLVLDAKTAQFLSLESWFVGCLRALPRVAAMTLAEKLEQAFTKRPNSYLPARTLERLLGLQERPDSERLLFNWAMHWGQGIALGIVRP